MFNLEAMLAGKPVISSRYGGLSEMIAHGKTGFLIDTMAIDEISDLITDLLSNQSKLQRIGEAAQKHVKENLSLKKNITALKSLYFSSLQKGE